MSAEHHSGLSPAGARSGKLGIALSGGGFRAALFHVGVLARLAECDLLRHASLISTVSGGSIIGAFYYLKLKQLLEGRRGDSLEPTAEGYRQLVREVEREFLEAMQHNVRMMAFADRRQNSRMLTSDYSPTQRLAELFNTYFFAPITSSEENFLRDLPIRPAPGLAVSATGGAAGSDSVALPSLVLNATALNTGHLFQFTGHHVGEPAVSSVAGGTQTIPLLPRLHVGDPTLTARQRARLEQITLGEAVAASCCVPGLFEPLGLSGLYQDADGGEVVVRLVDGGVFDNQGLVSLFEDGCTHFVCSDASELLQWQPKPLELIHNVAMRANDIMMDRIRTELLAELQLRSPEQWAVFTLGEPDGSGAFGEEAGRFLRALKAIRTDLDAFTDLEAAALMYHGYMVSGHHLAPEEEAGGAAGGGGALPEQWQFSAISQLAGDTAERARLLHHLDVGSRQFMKVFYLREPLPWIIVVLPTLIPVGFAVLLIYLLPPIPTSAWVVLGLIVLTAIAFVQNARIIEWLDQIEGFRLARHRLAVAFKPVGITAFLGAIGALATWINLQIFNRLFLRYGRMGGAGPLRLRERGRDEPGASR
jgi:NTE family protein